MVITCGQIAIYELTYSAPQDVEDFYPGMARLRQTQFYQGRWIERVWIVLCQSIVGWQDIAGNVFDGRGRFDVHDTGREQRYQF